MTFRSTSTLLAAALPAAAALLSACASAPGGDSSANRAGVLCQGLANSDGLRAVEVGAPQAVDGGQRLTMKVEDRVGRRIDASCTVANGQPRWTTPLPAGLATR